MNSGTAYLHDSCPAHCEHSGYDPFIADAFDIGSSASTKNFDLKPDAYVPTSCQVLQYVARREGQGDCYWQIQYYIDPPDSPSSPSTVSSFAQTQKEADEIFYNTFPAARSSGRNCTPQPCPQSTSFDGMGFSFHSPGGDCSFDAAAGSLPTKTEGYMKRTSSELMIAINFSNGKSAGEIDSNLSQPLWREQAGGSARQSHSPPSTPTHDEMMMLEEVGDMPVSPQHRVVGNPTDIQYVNDITMDSCSLHRHHASPNDPVCFGCGSEKNGDEMVQDLNLLPSPTGTWPSLRTRTHPGPHQSASTSPCVSGIVKLEDDNHVIPHSRSSMDPLAGPSATSAASSSNAPEQTDSPVHFEPPALMRLSPLPAHRRPAEKKKAQTLACNFCRARKIACGPPLPGTTERTCNQCQRRSFKCVFPTESRRGMRKKKTPSKDSPK